jgi:hypothetical protein
MRLRTSRHVETAILIEIAHDLVDVVGIECVDNAIKQRNHVTIIRHFSAPDKR